MVFCNGSGCDQHFIIKELAKEFEKQFTCLGENPEKWITFSVPIEKELAWISMAIILKKDQSKIISIRERLCHTIHRYVKANGKCMEDYDKDKDLSCLKYQDVNKRHGWEMSQKVACK